MEYSKAVEEVARNSIVEDSNTMLSCLGFPVRRQDAHRRWTSSVRRLIPRKPSSPNPLNLHSSSEIGKERQSRDMEEVE